MIESSYPNQTRTLQSSFAVPTAEQHDLNPLYWDAYKAEQPLVTQHCPSASGVPEWGLYKDSVIASMPPAPPYDNSAVGRNAAVSDASIWEWEENPQSGNNMVIEGTRSRPRP
jgi:hypothetical protein